MKAGIVGYAGSGKTTIFNALTGLEAPVGDCGGGKVHLGTIRVPDKRIERLAEIYRPKKITFAELTCVDIPGARSRSGEGLDSRTLEQIRDVTALALVVGAFNGEPVKPVEMVDNFLMELLLTDQMLVERRLDKQAKSLEKKRENEALRKLLEHMLSEKMLSTLELDESDRSHIQHYAFVSDKPVVVVINTDESSLEDGTYEQDAAELTVRGIPTFVLSGRLEHELSELELEDQLAFLEELDLTETARDRFIHAIYGALDLITFLTAGDKEVHAWPVSNGCTAKKAAGTIHTDLERGFIRAEVFHFDDIDLHEDEAKLRAIGKLRVEGKDYIVQDGDVILVHHS